MLARSNPLKRKGSVFTTNPTRFWCSTRSRFANGTPRTTSDSPVAFAQSLAKVAINGRMQTEVTPMKLTLFEGAYDIEVMIDGYELHKFSTEIVGGEKVEPIRKDIDLQPISREGLYTVSISISPIAANITLDETVHAGKRTLKVPNVDPNRPHRIVVEAGGYVKIEQDIPVGQLKTDYNFVLQKSESFGRCREQPAQLSQI